MILIFGSVILNKVLCASAKILDSIFEGTVDKSTKLNAMHIFQEENGVTVATTDEFMEALRQKKASLR